MRLGVLYCIYNAERFIGPALEQLAPYAERQVVHLGTRPWCGEAGPPDRTRHLLARHFPAVEVWEQAWPDETCQRNQGLGRLRWCDYVWICDADEYYTTADIEHILTQLASGQAVYTIRQKSYWKTPDWRWDPLDTWPPVVVMNPNRSFFFEFRAPVHGLSDAGVETLTDVHLHHFNYVRTDAELAEKIRHFSHAADLRPEWQAQAWEGWAPYSPVNVYPYKGGERQAIYDPAPAEIVARWTRWQEQIQ
jgi:hypothetical protein